jgi:hypothetical protein
MECPLIERLCHEARKRFFCGKDRMNRKTPIALLVWIFLCIPVFGQGGGLQVFSQAAEMSFPDGYAVYTERGKAVKNVPGPASATIKAKALGKSFAPGEAYLSDWSFERMQKGEKPNWIVPNAESVALKASPAALPSDPNGLVIYRSVKELSFAGGYSVFTDDGQLIKNVPGPTSIALMGESGEKTFANGTAYLSDWSFEQMQTGKPPNWVVPKLPVENGNLQAVQADRNASASRGMSVKLAEESRRGTSSRQDVVLFPDPIDAQLASFKVVDEQGAILREYQGPEIVITLSGYIPKAGKYLSQESYERLNNGESANFIVPVNGNSPSLYRGRPWNPFEGLDLRLPVVDPDNTYPDYDPWDQVCDYTRTNTISAIVFAHHPTTYLSYMEWSKGFGVNPWDNVFSIDGFSHDVANETGPNHSETAFHIYSMLNEKERRWLDGSMPGLYQALADIFRSDLSSAAEPLKIASKLGYEQADDTIYMRFYRSPFIRKLEKQTMDVRFVNGRLERGHYEHQFIRYVRWFDLDEQSRAALPKAAPPLQPSFYGLAIYKAGTLVGNYPLFGAVDFEAFVEIMVRNYTKREFGLTLASADGWLENSFNSIYRRIFGFCRSHLSGVKRIFWTAEGYFNLVPLDLIAVSCGKEDGIDNIPMVEVANADAISKVSSIRSGLHKRGALLVANPEYDKAGHRVVGDSLYDEHTAKLVSRAFSNRSLTFANLPGADNEVGQLSSELNVKGIKDVTILRKEQASEDVIVEKLRHVGLAHIATHGFYLDMTLATDEQGKQLLSELKNRGNPYFRSGLALAGANKTLSKWSKGKVTGSSTDGVLLASEVRNLDLKNLSLLVLSACSTAEGKPVDGKSVASLREAFLQAGVETLVSTLWDIPDDFAAKLMSDFYQLLLAGETPSVALWRAKKDNFLELRKTTGFAESMVKVAPFVAVTQAAKPD